MKKIWIFLLLLLVSLTSCDKLCFCDEIYDEYPSHNTKPNREGDKFYADKLLGTWQTTSTYVGNLEIKQIEFINNRLCDITYSEGYRTTWYTETFLYSYSGGYLTFGRADDKYSFAFKIEGYTYPELYLRDSFGQYAWHKVKSYGC